MSVLKEKGVSWFCLKFGDYICDCRRKRIWGENGYIRIYYKLIYSEVVLINVFVIVSVCSSLLCGICLF